MDLLCVPDDPAGPTERTRYRCKEVWDGGLFCTYAYRKGRVGLIPLGLRQRPEAPPTDEPYTEIVNPTPKDELEPFIQTWLFFGLLAEFLALNELPSGQRLIEEPAALEQIERMHGDLWDEQGGVKYISGKKVLLMGSLFRERVLLATDRAQRMKYLSECLQYTMFVSQVNIVNIDDSVRYAISALGEIFSTSVNSTVNQGLLNVKLPPVGFNWHRNYIRPGGPVEYFMKDNGWCVSEIEKVRSQFQGIHTMHYISRLKRPHRNLDHGSCTAHICKAFQTKVKTFRPLHINETCACENIGVDMEAISDILRNTNTYPVISVEHPSEDPSDLRLVVEPRRDDVPYVALSHVWSDGLGNPVENSLPRCQVARVALLFSALQAKQEADTNPPTQGLAYRVWIDTLCCPVELDGKMIALERIADVYRNAGHVLVLDNSLTPFKAEGTHPAELLLRAFGLSPWMRRLWTLQEGALGQNLQLQFSDKAVNNMELLTELYKRSTTDVRHLRVWLDVLIEFNQLLGFSPKTGDHNVLAWPSPTVPILQRALHFRAVSVPSDEALCIATLMNLDTHYIASADGVEGRMVRVWELIARKHNGQLPSKMIFYVEEPLEVPGWRFAPRSLLASSAARDTGLGLDERVVRFSDQALTLDDVGSPVGTPTAFGLKVSLPGCRLVPRPRLPALPLHPWPDMINPTEDQIVIRDEQTGQWFRIIDWYRSRQLASWTAEEKLEYDRQANDPLCRAIDTGNCALIYGTQSRSDNTRVCAMVQVVDSEAEDGTALKVRRKRSVILSKFSPSESNMMAIIQSVADIVAGDEATRELQDVQERSGQAWEDAKSKVRARMREAMAEAWRDHPELKQAVKENVGDGLYEFMWAYIPKLFSHDSMIQMLPDDQTWFVD